MGLTENSKPCWEATCDDCGEGDNFEYGGSFHYESRGEAVKALGDSEWKLTDERVLCAECAEKSDA